VCFLRYLAPAEYPNDRLGIEFEFLKFERRLVFGSSNFVKLTGLGVRPRFPRKKSFVATPATTE